MLRSSRLASTVVVLVLPTAALAAPRPRTKAPAAAEAKPRSLADELTGASLDAYEQGRTLFDHGDFATAHAKFKQAFDASKHPRLLWNMAACSAKQKQYALAIDEVERHLALGAGSLSAEQVAKAEAFRNEVRGYVAEATFEVSPAGARLTLDRVPRGEIGAARPLYVDVGTHEVLLEKAGYEPIRDSLVVHDVGKLVLPFSLKPLVAPSAASAGSVAPVAPANAATTTSTPGPAASAPQGANAQAITGWTLVGVGAAALAGGVFEHLAARSAASDFEAKCEGKVCDVSARADYDRATSAATVATSLYVGGAVLAGVGAVVLAWPSGSEAGARALRLSVAPNGVRLWGAF